MSKDDSRQSKQPAPEGAQSPTNSEKAAEAAAEPAHLRGDKEAGRPDDMFARLEEELVQEEAQEAAQEEGSTSLPPREYESESLPATSFEEDDEAFLSDDEVVLEEKNLAIVKQMERVVSWELTNFYKENGKVPNKFVMRGSPPVFKVESSRGDMAEFMVTKELAATLERAFGDVRKAYYGIDPTVKKTSFGQAALKDKAAALGEWAKDNPFKALLGVLLVVLFLLSPFLY